MKRRLVFLVLTALTVVALINVALAVATPASANGATQIAGIAYWAEPGECTHPQGAGADFALTMTGSLEGCLYTFVETAVCRPSGTYIETGKDVFVGQGSGNDMFVMTYKFEAKYHDCTNLGGEVFGRCQHPIITGSGVGVYEDVTGRLDFKDDVEAGIFYYRGHIQY